VRGAWFAATLVVVGMTASATTAAASPSAELVLLWAPGRAQLAPATTQAARQLGAAVLDVTPTSAPRVAEVQALRSGRAAYEALRFEEALGSLSVAAQSVEASGGAGLSSAELSDVFLYRALAAVQLGNVEAAWDDFVRAATVAPSRGLDPAQFPPRAVEQFERARGYVAALPLVTVRLDAPPSCEIAIDARVTAEREVALPRGRHWLVATCAGHLPGQRGFDATEALLLRAAGPPLAPLRDDDALVQARSMGARAVLVVTVSGELALLRRLGVDGREQARRGVQLVGAAAPAALADEVAGLLRERAPRSPWYRSRWAWAAAGVATASAVLLPLLLRADEAPEVVLRPQGVPW
jgi:hypothetical protein